MLMSDSDVEKAVVLLALTYFYQKPASRQQVATAGC
jgi:hypothetical protein